MGHFPLQYVNVTRDSDDSAKKDVKHQNLPLHSTWVIFHASIKMFDTVLLAAPKMAARPMVAGADGVAPLGGAGRRD